MTLKEIKEILGFEMILFSRKDENSEWYYNWNEETRVQIAIHQSTADLIEKDENYNRLSLSVKEKMSNTTNMSYINKTICTYTDSGYYKKLLFEKFENYFNDNKTYFPDVIVSSQLKNFIKNHKQLIIEDKFKHPIIFSEPVEPEKEVFFTSFKYAFVFNIWAIPFFWLAFSFLVAVIIFILSFIIASIYEIKKYIRYKKATSDYKERLREYEIKMEQYEIDLKEYNKNVKRLNHFFEDEFYLIKQRHSYMRSKGFFNAYRPSVNYENKTIGVAEKDFKYYLDKYFPNEIFTDRVIEVFNSFREIEKSTYISDFVFMNNRHPLTIDIEIDEPYTFDGKPIHCLDNEHDARRNKYFTDKNWIVVRFSEEQVKMNPDGCCAFLADIIYYFTGDDSYLEMFENISRIYQHRKWTEEDAKELYRLDFRNMIGIGMEEILS